MDEKHNHSNDPTEKQPTLDDGTFTFKNKKASPEAIELAAGAVKNKGNYDEEELKEKFSESAIEEVCLNEYGFNIEETEFVKYALAKNGLLWDDDGNKVPFVKDPNFEGEPKEESDDDLSPDDLEEEDFDDSDLINYFEGDKNIDFDSFNKVIDGFAAEEAKHKAEIEEAEKSMGSTKKGVYDSYKDIYELDATKIDKATDEEIAELQNAINTLVGQEQEKKLEAFKPDLDKEINDSVQKLQTTFKEFLYSFTIDKYPQIKDKIPAKIGYLEQQMALAKENGQDYLFGTIQGKIDALNNLESLYEKSEQAKNEKEQSQKAANDANAVIAKFQDQNSLYSVARHEKAILLETNEEARQAYLPEALKQRKNMTDAEEKALVKYTGQGYSTMNKPLHGLNHESEWGSKASAISEAMSMITNITSALDKCALEKDCTFIRRVGPHMDFGVFKGADIMNNESNLKKLIGAEFKDNSIMSCSANSKVMGTWNNIDMLVYCPKGTKAHYVSDISQHSHESEVILGRGYHLVVRDAYRDKKTGKPTIKVDVILGSDKDRLTDEQMKAMYEKYLV